MRGTWRNELSSCEPGVILKLYGNNGKYNENYYSISGIMEKKMETIIMGYIGYVGSF